MIATFHRLLKGLDQVSGLPIFTGILSRLHKGKVHVAGMECTGSTFVYQVAKALGASPIKVHSYVEHPSMKLVTYRDPRDVICSYARRQFRRISESNGIEAGLIESHRKLFHEFRRHEDLRKYRDDPRTVLIRYEEYFNGREEKLVDLLTDHLEKPIDGTMKRKLLDEYSLEKNKQRSQQFSSFKEYDRETHIHGDHISSDGRTGIWQDLFTPSLKDLVKEDLGDFLVEFGYEMELDW